VPGRPQILFDGNCGFCRIWIKYWKQLTGDAVDYAPFETPRPAVELVQPDGTKLSGAAAVVASLRYAPQPHWLVWLYDHVPGFPRIAEPLYRLIASHRDAAYWCTRLFFGTTIQPASYYRIAWVFLRLIGLIYLIAFASLAVQITGLIGSRGILPLARFLPAVQQRWMVPTVFWLNSSDTALRVVCWAGVAVSLSIVLGFAQRICFAIAFVLYLSLCSAGQDFLSFQWDMLLLECGFLAVFLAPTSAIVWLYRLILFRLMFLSGAVKLLSHDSAWRSLDALRFHYWTQPLPTPVAWYANLLPDWFQRLSTVGVFAIELALPFLIFLPRRCKLVAAAGFVFLQVFILLTGSYTFFNLLAISLCVFLLDDAFLGAPFRIAPASKRSGILVVVLGSLGVLQIVATVTRIPQSAEALLGLIAPYGIVNSYGLFAVMTTSRPEIIVQGSNDGTTWLDYEFKFKPGDVKRAPPWVAPYQPRLDWQMWFAALSNWRANPWFVNFLARLLQGSPEVLELLGKNPFPNQPPRYVRALVYDYRFTRNHGDGAWWSREPRGLYLRPISLDDLR
jgi:predicted DCC family thiol-disulfide oxidoreductase YuxK